jgi:DNA-binding beta-propeller fold protein YncE
MRLPLVCVVAVIAVLASLAVRALGEDAAPARDGRPAGPPEPLLRLEGAVALPGVEGRIDHLALDAAGKTLAVAALENKSVEVIDAEARTLRRHVAGLASPQGVAILEKTGRIVVGCGEDATVRWIDGKTFEIAATVKLDGDSDNVRVDASVEGGRIYVGYGDGALAVIEKEALVGTIPLAGHPEAFSLEAKGPRIYVNVPDAKHVAVVDRTKAKVVETWPLKEAAENFPMALDEANARLFVGCRSPARLLVLDTADGHLVAALEIAGDVDDLHYDAATKRVFCTCGDGFIHVIAQADRDHYTPSARVPTGAGARTSLLTPDGKRLYLAVPHRGAQKAEIRVYAVGP